ncbi:prepilin peptidase [Kitasatospora sp. NPDC006697]|uniref:prepilin peptidase n=1 Tax=Kitasatospora sp. NPDC006697 TaxID=3364020 RepID=UPI00368F2343
MIAESVAALGGLAAAPVLRGTAARLSVPRGEAPRNCACGRPPVWLPPTGRCPGCAAAFGPAPLGVELVAAATGAAVGAAVCWPIGPALVWVALLGVLLAFVDGAVHRLPDALTLPLAGGTAVLLALAALLDHRAGTLTRCLLGALALLLFYGLLSLLGPLGWGDVKLAPTLGALLAWYGWRPLLQGTVAGFLLAAAWGTVLLLTGRAKAKDPLPFGPCMLLGALVGVLAAG